mmetsp:Transcript_128715/g.333731  ORF Transcript_128715/g.333731 Transcript_128715/m.333731 type:complete len:203 (-) Transcript_128715:69-677(-)
MREGSGKLIPNPASSSFLYKMSTNEVMSVFNASNLAIMALALWSVFVRTSIRIFSASGPPGHSVVVVGTVVDVTTASAADPASSAGGGAGVGEAIMIGEVRAKVSPAATGVSTDGSNNKAAKSLEVRCRLRGRSGLSPATSSCNHSWLHNSASLSRLGGSNWRRPETAERATSLASMLPTMESSSACFSGMSLKGKRPAKSM